MSVPRPHSRRRGLRAIAASACTLFVMALFAGPASALEIEDVFASALACTLVSPALADMPVTSLFRDDGQGCAPASLDVAMDGWFLDASCSLPVAARATPLDAWCDTLLDTTGLGEVAGIGATPVWTLSPGSRVDVGARSLDGVSQPWLQRERFRTIQTAQGSCELEMRIYAPAPVVDGRIADGARSGPASGRALIAFHGGSWTSRGFGFFGLELTVPHFTERGFTVFAPFYRLLGDKEGSAACNQAQLEDDIVKDAFAALDWVRANGERFGVDGDPVLFGQSAGGQLAARVAVDRPEEVAAAVLFYAPSDFEDFVARAQSGAYTDEQGLGIIERVLGQSVALADVSASPVAPNSLPGRIAGNGIDAPPMFLLHGDADTLVEARQSVRLCDALAGRTLLAFDAEASATTGLREVTGCGDESTLHRVLQGQHALDVCLASVQFLPVDSCLSGSEQSRAVVADSIGSAAVFASTFADPSIDDPPDVLVVDDETPANPDGGSGGGGGGAAAILALLIGTLVLRRVADAQPRSAGSPI